MATYLATKTIKHIQVSIIVDHVRYRAMIYDMRTFKLVRRMHDNDCLRLETRVVNWLNRYFTE